MYGWVHKCLKEVVLKLCGEDKWNEIIAKAKVEDDTLSSCNSTTYHEDEEYFSIIKATLEVLPDISEQELYNLYGDHFISYVRENGYEAYLLTFGDTLFELLSNVNKLHIHLAAGSMDKIRIPIIDCERIEEPNSFLLRYSSPRGDRLTCLMVGMVKSVARTYFSTEVTLTELKRQGDAAGSSATVWKVLENRIGAAALPVDTTMYSAANVSVIRDKIDSSFSLSVDQFSLLAPCHMVFNSTFEIVVMSDNMSGTGTERNNKVGSKLQEHFRILGLSSERYNDMSWEEFQFSVDKGESTVLEATHEVTKSGRFCSFIGKIVFLKNSAGAVHAALFLCSPNVNTLEEMYDQGVSIRGLSECRMQMLLNEANVRHFQATSFEVSEKLSKEILTSKKAKGDLDAKRRLLMYISHEIRTPLSIVNFGFQLIKSQLGQVDTLIGEDSPSDSYRPHEGLASLGQLGQLALVPQEGRHGEGAAKQKRLSDVKQNINEISSITDDSSHSVQVAISILNDLLNYEKLQTNMLEMYFEFVPCSLVQAVVDEFRVEAMYCKVHLSIRPFEDCLTTFMFADKQKISQAVRNFVSNALKFTPEGGSVTVTTELQPLPEGKIPATKVSKDGQKYLECGVHLVGVRDTGAGIAKENHDRVFHEMVQFSPNELQGGGGSGLGLFITNAILQKHEGDVGFDSEGLGHGCNFFFTLPVYRLVLDEQTSPDEESTCTAVSSATCSVLEGRTVLICDDSNLTRKMLKQVLLGMGCKKCHRARNGLEAVQLVEAGLKAEAGGTIEDDRVVPVFDFILLDDNMPELTGPEAALRLRSLGFSNPIIGVTGNVSSEDTANFLAAGADAVLCKPLDMSELVTALQKANHCL